MLIKLGLINSNLFFKMFVNVVQKFVITGDFTFPHASWNSRENAINGNENSLVKLLNDFFVEQLNTTYTRGEKILDLVITNVHERVKTCESLKPSDSGLLIDHTLSSSTSSSHAILSKK